MKVFISYYRKTGWFAASIFEQRLRDAGIEAIMDQKHFQAGKLPDEIERQVIECDILLVILSYNYYRSNWTKQEIILATQYKKFIYYVATGKDLRAKTPPTFESNSDDLPLELWGKEVSRWGDLLLDLLKKPIITGQVKDRDELLTSYFSKNVGCNRWVKEAVAHENISNSLHVSSCVELAHNLNGWKGWGDFYPHDCGTFIPETEVLEYIGNHLNKEESSKHSGFSDNENCALVSLSDWLSDTKYVELNFQALSYDLVRQVADNFEALYYQRSLAERPHLFDHGHLAFPHSVVVHMVLVTRDKYLILGQRSATPRFYENCWATTYEEHMRISLDQYDPFKTALRGLKEELVGEDRADITRDSVRFFSIFRELDYWQNISKGLNFWNINIGIAGIVHLKHLSTDDVFRQWLLRKVEGSGPGRQDPEFQHLAAITFSFDNLLRLAMEDTFNPATFSDLRVPAGVNKDFPNMVAAPWLQRQHPTNKIRLIRCLTSDYGNFRARLTKLS